MYLVIAYHGKGNGEVESDLRVLWGNLEHLSKIRKIEHVFCFQAVRENVGADLLMGVEYEGDTDPKPALQFNCNAGLGNLGNGRVDYWFYIRNPGELK